MTHQGFRQRVLISSLMLATAALSYSPAFAQTRGGTLTMSAEAEFSGFNHARARIFNQNTMAPASSVMETLFAYENNEIVPRLGLELTEAPDRLSATVKLRENVKFHDQTPFNADAVVAHYMWLLNPDTGVNTAILGPIESVEKVDDHTVKFNLKHPWTALNSALALENLVNLIGSPTALKNDPEGFHRKPIGTGPFVFKEWQAGDRVVLERNPDYWDSELPYLDKVVYRVLPDGNTRYQSIKSGEVDIGRVDTASLILDARKTEGLVVHDHEGSGGYMWNFNHTKPPFDDQRVRAAVVHAFNAPAMVDAYFLGTTKPSTDLLGPTSAWHCPDLNWRSYDLEKAKELVKDVGKPIQFELVSTNTPAGRRQAAMIQQFVKAAGMQADIRLVEQSQNVRVGLSGDYQMDVWRFNDTGGDPDLVLSYYFGGAQGQPVTRHDTSAVDEILAKAKVETDRQTRHDLYCQVAQQFSDQAIALIPIRTTYSAVAHPYVKGLPAMQNNLIRVRAMWLDK